MPRNKYLEETGKVKKNLFGRFVGAALSVCMAFGSAGLTVFAEELEDVGPGRMDYPDVCAISGSGGRGPSRGGGPGPCGRWR